MAIAMTLPRPAETDDAAFEEVIRGSIDAGLEQIAQASVTYGGTAGVRVAKAADAARERQRNHAIWIVLIIAVVVLAGIGAMTYVAIYCIRRGGSYAGGLSISRNGWKVWEYRLQFKCTR
jgi:hypothetical protein